MRDNSATDTREREKLQSAARARLSHARGKPRGLGTCVLLHHRSADMARDPQTIPPKLAPVWRLYGFPQFHGYVFGAIMPIVEWRATGFFRGRSFIWTFFFYFC